MNRRLDALRPATPSHGALLLALGMMVFLGCGCVSHSTTRPMGFQSKGQSAHFDEELRSLDKLTVPELLQRGEVVLGEGNTNLARAYFASALQKAPDSPAAQLGMARVLIASGEQRAARALVEQVLKQHPEQIAALSLRGRLWREQGNLTAASADFRQALLQAPDDPQLLTELAMTYDLLPDRLVEAATLYRRVVALLPDISSAHNNLGFNALLRGEATEALSELSAALRLAPDNQRILCNYASAWLLAGEEERALRLFSRTLSTAEAYNNLGYLYMGQRRWQQAEAAFKRALELNPRFYVRADTNLQTLYALRARDQAGKREN